MLERINVVCTSWGARALHYIGNMKILIQTFGVACSKKNEPLYRCLHVHVGALYAILKITLIAALTRCWMNVFDANMILCTICRASCCSFCCTFTPWSEWTHTYPGLCIYMKHDSTDSRQALRLGRQQSITVSSI